MGRKRFLVSVLMAFLLIGSTSTAWTSSVGTNVENFFNDPGPSFDGQVWQRAEIAYATYSGSLFYSPSSPGPFTMEGSYSVGITYMAWTNGGPPGPDSVGISYSGLSPMVMTRLFQDGPLRFDNISGSFTFHHDGLFYTEHCEYVASPDDLNPLYPGCSLGLGYDYFASGGSYVGSSIPMSYIGDGYDFNWGSGSVTIPYEITFSLSGDVVSTMPIPSALLLLGSGLGGLAIYGRRKIAS